jgi:AAA15 family ATPase/GTPase
LFDRGRCDLSFDNITAAVNELKRRGIMPVTINELNIENVKRVKAVRLEPKRNGLTVIGGKNGQGKTSVLDSIAWVLGGNKFKPTSPQNTDSVIPPYLKVKLSNGLEVERKGKNGDLRVIDPSGKRAGQTLLDSFVNELALDLPQFLAANDKEKALTLLKILGIGDKLEELEEREKYLYNQRLAIGQVADQKEKYAKEMTSYPDAPKDLISASDLIMQQQEILARNGENQRKRQQLAELNRRAQELTEQITRLQEEYMVIKSDLETAAKSAIDLQDESTEELECNLRNVEAINIQVRANLDQEKAFEDARNHRQQYDTLTTTINSCRQERLDLLNGADLPLPGLSVENGALTYNGQKWDCMSSADQLKIAVAIIRQTKPECGFVLMDKLEQMDTETLADFAAWLEDEGLQVIATRVSVGGECHIIISDGYAIEAAAAAPMQTYKEGVF